MSRALGDHFTKQEKTGITGEPTVSAAIKLLPTDTILILASDGVRPLLPSFGLLFLPPPGRS